MQEYDVVIVGAGISGLTAASVLQSKGYSVKILELASEPGGRMRSENYAGFILDRGFHLFLNALPEAKSTLDYDKLQLKSLYPGILVYYKGEFNIISNPLKKSLDILSMSVAGNATFWDKIKLGKLFNEIQQMDEYEIFNIPEKTSLEFLTEYGFSNKIIQSFFKPLLSTAFLENEMKTSSRLLHFNLKMLFSEDASLPKEGIGAIPQKMADQLLPGTIQYKSKVKRIDDNMLELTTGEIICGKKIILSANAMDLEKICPGLSGNIDAHHVSTLYFAASSAPVKKPIVMLNGEGKGIVNNVFVPSLVQPSYAPNGMHLISVNVTKPNDFDDYELVDQVQMELIDWFGTQVSQWEHLKTYHIKYAIPRKKSISFSSYAKQISDDLFICGDHLTYGSLNAALRSGKEVALRVEESIVSGRTTEHFTKAAI